MQLKTETENSIFDEEDATEKDKVQVNEWLNLLKYQRR